MSCLRYSNTIGYLLYAMVCTRPDISHAVGVVGKYTENPRKKDWNALKWVHNGHNRQRFTHVTSFMKYIVHGWDM